MKHRWNVLEAYVTAFVVLFICIVGSVKSYADDFDPQYYASRYPDVYAAYGNDAAALYSHYLNFGMKEHRFKNAQEEASGTYSETLSTYIDVDITNQTVTYYKDGVVVLTSPCVTGTPSTGNSTPKGVFQILNKTPGKYLTGPSWHVWVNRWMRFTGAVGLHDANWRSNFGGTIYQSNGSHGCVNLPSDVASQLYDMVDVGTAVVVH